MNLRSAEWKKNVNLYLRLSRLVTIFVSMAATPDEQTEVSQMPKSRGWDWRIDPQGADSLQLYPVISLGIIP